MNQKISSKRIHIVAMAAGVVLVGAFFWSALSTLAFVGPAQSPPSGSGSVNSDAYNNVYIAGNLNVTGTIYSASNYTGLISAGNIASGQFGLNAGAPSNYYFPVNVGIATTSAAYPLTVNGTTSAAAYCISGANCITAWPSAPSAANPSALIGTSAVNGVASTFMRSDAAPTIDQTAAFSFSGLGNTTSTGNVSAASVDITSATTTAAIGGSSLVLGKCNTVNATITGATTTIGAVFVSPVTYPGASVLWSGYVSAANTVTVQECVTTSTTPTSSKFNVVYVY